MGNETEGFKWLNRSIIFDMHILAFYYFIVSCCVTCTGRKSALLCCNISDFSKGKCSFLRLCLPHFQLWKSVHVPSVVSCGLSRLLCIFQSILCSNTAYKSPSPSHRNVGWNHISILCSYSQDSKASAAPEDCQVFSVDGQQGGLQLRVT